MIIVDMLSVPPATTTWSMPARMDEAAICTAESPAAQWRLSARPGTWVRPSCTATLRAITPPPASDSATITSSKSEAGMPLRAMAAPTATRASSRSSTPTSVPLRARPIGVRAVATITASVIRIPLGSGGEPGEGPAPVGW